MYGVEFDEYDWDQIWNVSEPEREGSEVLHSWKSDHCEPNFAGIVKTADGKVWSFSAWHDYTGWDCQSGLEWFGPYDNKVDAVKELGVEERRGLGFLPRIEYDNLWTD